MLAYAYMHVLFFFSIRRRHTRCALVTGVQTCALPIYTARQSRIEIRPGLVRLLSGQSSVARLRPKLAARGIARDIGFVGGLLQCCHRGKPTLLLRIGTAQALPGQVPAPRDKPLLRPFRTNFGTVNGGVTAGL